MTQGTQPRIPWMFLLFVFIIAVVVTLNVTSCTSSDVSDRELANHFKDIYGSMSQTCREIKVIDSLGVMPTETINELVEKWNATALRYNKALSGQDLKFVERFGLQYIPPMYREHDQAIKPKKIRADLRIA